MSLASTPLRLAARDIAAPGKINLALHVTGQRSDGYHTLSSLVAFADFGDRLSVAPATGDRFQVSGRFADALADSLPADGENILARTLRLARSVARLHGVRIEPLAISLEKRLPVASGIGGGSADAAALLRFIADACCVLAAPLRRASLDLGADVPMCMEGRAARVGGIGDDVTAISRFPAIPAVLVNPGVPVSTPLVFRHLTKKNNAPMPELLTFGSVRDVAEFLAKTRNDLEAPANCFAPSIGEARSLLESRGALFARMSGSGATVFGLFADSESAEDAASAIRDARPDWWIVSTRLGSPGRIE